MNSIQRTNPQEAGLSKSDMPMRKTFLQKVEMSNNALKIREIDSINPVKAALKYAMFTLGLSQAQMPSKLEFDALVQYTIDNFPSIAPEKIQLAFDAAISGKFDIEMNLFGAVFSPMYLSKVVYAYLEYEHKLNLKNKAQVEPEPQPTEEQKQKMFYKAALFCFDRYKKTGDCLDWGNVVYKFLEQDGRMNFPEELWNIFKEKAISTIRRQKSAEKIKNPLNAKGINDYLSNLSSNGSDEVKSEACRQALICYFDELIKKAVELSDVIENKE